MPNEPSSAERLPLILHHEPRPRTWLSPQVNRERRKAIEHHLKARLSGESFTLHEVLSDVVHLDVCVFCPTPDRPFYTLITVGMSDIPMAVPVGAEEYRFGELMLCLPPDWPMTQEALRSEDNWWPIRMLKMLARMPHAYDSWLGWGHSLPNGEPPAPLGDSGFVGVVLGFPMQLGRDFLCLEQGQNKVWFYALYPVYAEEMTFKLRCGSQALINRLAAQGVSELVDVRRANSCA